MKSRYGTAGNFNSQIMAQQEDLNREFVSAISRLEVTSMDLKDEMQELKSSVTELIKQMVQIKLMFLGLVLGVLLNANPNDWIKFFHSFITMVAH